MKLQDNITTLGLAANAMVQENKLEPEQIASVHLDAFAKIQYSPELMSSIQTTRFCMKTDT